MKKLILLITCSVSFILSFAQGDTVRPITTIPNPIILPPHVWPHYSPIKYSGYVDAYYSYNFNTPVNDNNSYYYNYNRHNEYTTNLALFKAEYKNNNVIANLGLMTGTYVQANLAGEPGALQHIYEANVGYKFKNSRWTITAGIMESHLGFEGVKNTENLTLTRSLANENSPYYMSGTKLGYHSPDNKFDLDVVLINGWQNMREQQENSNKAIGVKAEYKASGWVLTYANFYGNEMPDTLKQNRFFNNLYAKFKPKDKLDILVGLDYGIQQDSNGGKAHTWMVPTAIGRYMFKQNWYVTGRVEWFDDPDQVIVENEATKRSYSVFGTSLGIDYKPMPNVRFGIEGRYLDGWDVGGGERKFTFVARDGIRYSQTTFTALMAISF